ncbi:MAG: polysaccharide biosynthesis tyrosine autokinase [Bacteroidales bacterium]|nr:polysaccharide biosynthesis tyrosine autokinase [Bacteroidales bacterium]
MTNTIDNKKGPQDKLPQQESGFNPMMILTILKDNWYYILLGLFIALVIARFYIGHTLPVYRVSATILINQGEERALGNNEEILQGMGLPGSMRNLDNQIMILTSKSLTGRALEELSFETDFYYKTFRNELSLYPERPVRLIIDDATEFPKDTEFSITYLGDNRFNIECTHSYYDFQETVLFGQAIESPWGEFRIECLDPEWFNYNQDQEFYFVIHSPTSLVNYFNRRIDVDLLSRSGSILEVSMLGTNRIRDVDFVNKLLDVFQDISLDKKNTEALRRIQFIDEQIVGISDSLLITENKLQDFRSANRVMDLSAQGQSIIEELTRLEAERANLNLEADYYDYLADYLAKDITQELPIVPISMGINDPGLTRLVENLADLQGQLLNEGIGEMNPMQNLLQQRISSTKDALLETLNGLRRANSLAISENQEQIARVNRQASALPGTERQLLGIERQFRLNDELYTFLLETRAEQQMQKASNTADSEIIDSAREEFSFIVSPNPLRVYFVAMFAGAGLPFLIILLLLMLNKRLKEEDVRKIKNIPIVGNIPHSTSKTNTVVFSYPNSGVSEAYRMLRSKLQFYAQETKASVTLVTSSMPKDGKTHTAINLASVYSLLGKKTILVGFDLRKPRIYEDFNLENDKGISTWLIGNDKLEDIIQETSYENLSVITAGPIPPNPSELTAREKTGELFQLLKKKYDIIIVDSSPIGFISDTVQIASQADVCLLVVRPGQTLRDMLDTTLKEMSANGFKGVGIVINDIQSDKKHYGDKYGYTEEKKKSRWLPLNKSKRNSIKRKDTETQQV